MLGEDYDMKKEPWSSDDVESLKKEADDLRWEVKKLRIERDVLLKAAELLKNKVHFNKVYYRTGQYIPLGFVHYPLYIQGLLQHLFGQLIEQSLFLSASQLFHYIR